MNQSSRVADAVYGVGLVAAVVWAFVLMAGCSALPGAAQDVLAGCDEQRAFEELRSCVRDADVPEGREQAQQVITWCAARAALFACPVYQREVLK